MKGKILFIGGSIGTVDMIKYAKSKGMHTIVTDYIDIRHSEAKRIADEYWMDSYADIDLLEKKCKAEKVCAVAAASSVYAINAMMELCGRLNLPCYIDKESFYYEKNKAAFKRKCREAGVLVPKDYILSDNLSDDELEQIDFPVVVKPVDQCGSMGVAYCYNKQELIQAYCKVKEISDNSEIIIEKKLEGKEFAAYYALAEGEASLLFMHSELAADKNRPSGSFAVSTITDCIEEFVAKANDKIIEALKKCGCRENIAWVQLKQEEDGEFYVFELGYRLGADYAPFEYSYIGGFDIVKWSVECALGVKHTREQLPKGLEHKMEICVFSYMLCSKGGGRIKEIKGVKELKAQHYDIALDICEGDFIENAEKTIGYVGFLAKSVEEVCDKIEEINKELQILNEDNENMIFTYMTRERFLAEEL